MERESNPMEAMCRSGCGFYGNPATDGLCSICFKEAVKKKQQPPNAAPTPSNNHSMVNTGATAVTTPLAAATPTVPQCIPSLHDSDISEKLCGESDAGSEGAGCSADSPGSADDRKKKNRCAVCRKKVGLTGFECRCGGLFCSVHRYSDKHECRFDYRELGAQEIRRNNPVVVSQKIHKI